MSDITWRHVACPLCLADTPKVLLRDIVPTSEGPVSFAICGCGQCGFRYVDPRGTSPVLDNEEGGGAREDASRSNRPIYSTGLARLRALGLDREGRILDVGCAFGDFLAFAVETGLRAEGVDINPAYVEHARGRGFTVWEADVGDLDPVEPYDSVTMWDVIEHVDDPVGFLRSSGALLRPGGLLMFHTGNASFQIPKARVMRTLRPHGPSQLVPHQHLSHFDPRTARLAVEKAGLELIEIRSFGTLRYPHPAKRAAMGAINALGALPPLLGGPLLTNAMGVIARRPL